MLKVIGGTRGRDGIVGFVLLVLAVTFFCFLFISVDVVDVVAIRGLEPRLRG